MAGRDNAAAQRMANDTSFPEYLAALSPRWTTDTGGKRRLVGTSRNGRRSRLAAESGEITASMALDCASVMTGRLRSLAWAMRLLAEDSLGQRRCADEFRDFSDMAADLLEEYMDDFDELVAIAEYERMAIARGEI